VSAAQELERISARLREIATALRSEELPEDQADTLAREAADLVTEAGNQLERADAELDDARE